MAGRKMPRSAERLRRRSDVWRCAVASVDILPSQRARRQMAPRKPSSTAEVALVPLKNCLVNLPPSLVSLLVNANAVSPPVSAPAA